MEEIKGYVEHIVYRNTENGYTVCQLTNDDGELICVGIFQYISEGECLKVTGEYTMHSTYGMQFKVHSYEIVTPDDVISMERYLGSGAIKGIGVALAGRIVKKFQEDTFRIIEEEPERLAEVKGISEKKAREIAIQMEEKKDMRKAMIFLQKYGVTAALAAKIYQYYGQNVYRVLEENPYQLADHIQGIGFKTADEIAMNVGLHTYSDFRIRSGLLYALQQSLADGHVYLLKEELLHKASTLLGIEIIEIEKYLMDLSMEKKVVLKDSEKGVRVYTNRFYYMELNTAKMLHDLNLKYDESETILEHRLSKIEQNTELELDEMQREAVKSAMKNGIMVLTGGPGTGKTTTINVMLRYFESEGMEFLLAAPTGRAAKRMTEATGYEAQTIHRLLEVSGNPEDENAKNGFLKNEENPLEADAVIIDEMSMVDLPLIHALLKAIMPGTRLILVGDVNQLPSVGPGSVLKDIIASNKFPKVELTKIFRQAQESDIVVNAHKINRGDSVILDNKSKDFFFLKRDDPNVIISVLLTLIQKKMPKYVQAKPYDIQVLTPMRKGVLGVERLNSILQKYLNPADSIKAEKEYAGKVFRVGDKVMQIKNNYQLEWEISTKYGLVVDKGMGIITDINSYTETVEIEYDEKRKVKYSFEQLDELEHAYAITIHKSQGSEYPAVLIPLLAGPKQLYHRNLLYTAITRAKSCVTIVGSDEVFHHMVENVNEQNRNTSLDERIEEIVRENRP